MSDYFNPGEQAEAFERLGIMRAAGLVMPTCDCEVCRRSSMFCTADLGIVTEFWEHWPRNPDGSLIPAKVKK